MIYVPRRSRRAMGDTLRKKAEGWLRHPKLCHRAKGGGPGENRTPALAMRMPCNTTLLRARFVGNI